MTLAGAIIMILAMANALINFVIDQRIPAKVLETMLGFGLDETWQFLIVLNVFLLFLGMLMEGFSAILVAVPLIMPFAAQFHLQPFHLAVMFLLNLEIAYCAPPLGLNLFISSFRFNRPLVSLYRIVLPFTGILVIGLLITMYVPKVATVLVDGDIDDAYAKALANKEPPREAWLLQCVQEDRLNPLPCTAADREKFGKEGTTNPYLPAEAPQPDAEPTPDSGDSDADLLREMMGGGAPDAGGKETDEDLFKLMMEGTPDAGAKEKPPEKDKPKTDEELFKEMMGN
jgi:C4-dicarboxylate transporter DctM subunit